MTNKAEKIKSFLFEKLSINNTALLAKFAKDLGYSDENILIIEGKEVDLFEQYPLTKQHLISCSHNRDWRSLFQYAEDLVYSWLMEDYLYYNLKKTINIKHDGGDKERIIIPSISITNASDFKIDIDGLDNRSVALEITNDYTGLFADRKICNFRDNKFLKLKNNSLTQKTLILGIDIINKKFFVIDVEKFKDYRKIESHKPFGGKPAYELSLNNVTIHEFNIDNVSKVIKNNLI